MTQDMTRKMTIIKKTLLMVLMLVFGINVSWGQVTPSTSSDPVYYLIQSTQCDAYYMRPHGNGTNVNAMNILTNDVRWYFVDAGTDTDTGTQYYYIVNNTGKYMYFARPDRDGDNRTYIELQTFNDANQDNYKFSIAEYNSSGTYNIIPKGNTDSYCLNKQGGITSDNNIQLANGFSDSGSLWKLIPASTFSFESPVRTTTGWYYKIQNSNNTSYFIKDVGGKGGASGSSYDNPAVTSNSTDENEVAKMKVHFQAASTDDALVTYYYIIAESGRYLYYRANSRNTDNATLFKNYAANDDERYRFMIVKGYNGSYNIISKYCTYNNGANISALKKVNDDDNRILSSQGGRNDKDAEWNFITLTLFCDPPTIIFNNATNEVTISTTTSGATIYYTMGDNPDDPTSTSNDGSGESGSSTVVIANVTSPTTIKAIATKDSYMDSDVAKKTITKVATPTIDFNDETYTITLASATTGSTIYYRIGTTGDYSPYEDPFVVEPGNTIYAYAVKEGCINSEINSFVAPDICALPVFTVTESTISIACSTDDSKIYYTEDGTDPDLDPEATVTPTLYEGPISATERKIIKAIAVLKNNSDVASEVVTLFNKPDVTLSQDTYTYDGTAHEPTVSKVAITISETEHEAAVATYAIGTYSNNTNAGTATVNLIDNNLTDNIFFGNFTKDFTINPAALTITPDDGQSKQYGDPDPVLTYTSAGLVEGDALTGALARAEGENAGSYDITQGTIDNSHNPNYAITFTTGKTFVITPKSLGDNTNPAENITIEITEANVEHVAVKQGGTPLRAGNEGTNYDYSISTEGNATTKYYKVIIYGRNNYEGSFKATFANLNLSKREGSSDAGGVATFVSNSGDGDFAVPDNMVAYIVTGINAVAGTVVVEPLDNIPENVPVLLLSTVDANGFVVTPKNDGTDPTGTNLLQEATSAMDVSAAEIYLLYKGEFVLNAAGTLPLGKVYLPNGGTPAPAILSIDWGVTSGIDEASFITTDIQHPAEWYTLEGVKLSGRPTKRGLYLREGKKIVVK